MRAFLLTCLLTAGCNSYDAFRISGTQQESFTNRVDLLFVVDNSTSMTAEGAELGLRFDSFITELTGETVSSANDLSDAVDNYIDFVNRDASFINFNIGITTPDIGSDQGMVRGPYARLGNPDAAEVFRETLLCDVVFFDPNEVISDPGYSCDPANPASPTAISEEYLDCLCGTGGWIHGSGGGNEEGIEAVFQAMCRAEDNPPQVCFERRDAENAPVASPFDETNIGENAGMLRENAVFVPVIISDEGDASRGLEGGEGDAGLYETWFRSFRRSMVWTVFGPTPGLCDQDAPVPDWSAARYEYMVNSSNGLYEPIVAEDCSVSNFEESLRRLGDLLNQLDRVFPLRAVPDPDTILAYVDGRRVERAESFEDGSFGDGWSYDPSQNAVVFHGTAIPDFREAVEIYYLPLEGNPRELPF